MKILCITESLGSGGAERQLVGLATLLHEQRYNVQFVTYINKQFYLNKLIEGKVAYKFLEKGDRKWNRFFVIRKALKHYQPDLVISFLPAPSQWVLLCKLSGLRFRLFVSERSATLSLTWKKRLKFWLYRFADFIVTNSHSEAERISMYFPSLSQKVVPITNFIETSYFYPPPAERNWSEVRMLVVGRLIPTKNALRLLKAIETVLKRGIDLRLRWVGSQYDLPYKAEVEKEVHALGLANVVEFVEHTTDVRKEYWEASLFCLPSLFEGYPNVVCEAMSCGLPILCSKVCDNPTIVQEAENGFLFDPMNIDEMIGAIERFVALSIAERHQMSGRNISRANELFSETRFVNQFINLLSEIK